MSLFEVIATGVSTNLESFDAMEVEQRKSLIESRAKELHSNEVFVRSSGAGVRGTTRLSNLLPIADQLMKP